jgi:hypothetical protein
LPRRDVRECAPARALGITSVTVTRDDTTGAVRWAFGDVGVDGALGALGVVTDSSRRGLEVEWVGEGWILAGTLTERCTDAGAALNGALDLQEAGQRDSVARAIDGTTWPGEARGSGWTAEVGWDVGSLGAP